MDIGAILDDVRRQTIDIFGSIDSAEAEIKVAMRRNPDVSDLLFGTFLSLRPLIPFCSDKLYRAHCQELLARVVAQADLAQPTKAEMLELLQRVSAFIPFHSHAGALYRRVFEEVFPHELGDDVDTLNERYPGETDGLRQEIADQLFKITAKREPARIDQRWRGDETTELNEEQPLTQMGLL